MTIISVVNFRSFGVNPVMHKSMMPLNIPEPVRRIFLIPI